VVVFPCHLPDRSDFPYYNRKPAKAGATFSAAAILNLADCALRTTDWKSVADKPNALKRVATPLQHASACFYTSL
jgi:hypothetical protein